jgi:hypothetical protein
VSKALARSYTSELRDELSHLAAWLPNDRVELGAIGAMEGHRFIPLSTLKREIGIEIGSTRTVDGGDDGELTYCTEGAVDVSAGIDGKASDPSSAGLVKAGAGVEVSFSKKHAVLLALTGCRATRVEDQLDLQRRIVEKWEQGDWQEEWCAITEVVEADCATVLASTAKGARIGLVGSAALEAGDILSLAKAGLKLRRAHGKQVGLRVLAQRQTTPLLKGLRLKERFWGKKPKLIIEGLDAEDADPFAGEELPSAFFDVLGED